MYRVDHEFHTHTFINRASETTLALELVSESLMPPSFSTRLLVENMEIVRGQSVLDLGAGTAVVGVAAKKLGAAEITLAEIEDGADQVMRVNVARNHEDVGAFDYVIGDLYAPLGRRRFDHILANPPSIPSPGDELPRPYRAGADGRLLHDAIQFLAPYYLKANGRLTLVHGSLSNVDLSLANLARLGFKCAVSDVFATPFRDFYPEEHIRMLADEGRAKFFVLDGVPHENRYVITATIGDEFHSPVMRILDELGIAFRMLPHKRIAKTVPLAAAERQVPVEQMVKCILLKDKAGKFVLACLTGEADLDVQRVREHVSGYSRLSFASPEEIAAVTGYELGSVAPFSLRREIPVVLDAAVEACARVNISSGDPRLGLELDCAGLLRALDGRARIGAIGKNAD